MDFILRIYFIGLIAFVPSEVSLKTTIIIEQARDGHKTADGHHIEPHLPLLLARGDCAGDCRPDQERIASFLYDLPTEPNLQASMRQLDQTLDGGGAWVLDDVEISLDLPSLANTKSRVLEYGPSLPTTARMPSDSAQARSFGWVADMRRVAPASATIDPRIYAGAPSLGLVAARFIADRGSLWSYRLVEVDGKIASLGFQPAAADRTSPHARAYADWVALDIPISQESCKQGVTITARPTGSGLPQSMTIKPDCTKEVAEFAFVNLPSWQAARRSPVTHPSPFGPHFELYYKLANHWPEPANRPVPALVTSANPLDPKTIGIKTPSSPLLQGLQLTDAKGSFAQPICISIAFAPPASGG